MANSLGNLSASALFSAAGQTVLITEGCSRTGIIAATTLVENGARVYIASKDEIRLQEIQEELSRRGPGSCDYIVANLEESRFRDSSWDLELASHVKSLLYVTGGLTELLAKAATSSIPGRIINIPIQVLRDCREDRAGAEQALSYDTHKSAVSHLTTVLSTSLACKHLSVNAILPDIGLTKTIHINRDIISLGEGLRYLDSVQDLAGILLFLASRVGSRVTGARIESEALQTHNITRWWGQRRASTSLV
ncbi:KR domain [Rhizoctonia solani]|uniref:KR domain n=1 Tax=Rhizoctonia solani TaxID=456999 RepID=A0A8H7HHK0_9AGAM|nr:KR domain [Rhizoctonia solani]